MGRQWLKPVRELLARRGERCPRHHIRVQPRECGASKAFGLLPSGICTRAKCSRHFLCRLRTFPFLITGLLTFYLISLLRNLNQEKRGVKLSSKFSRIAQLEINIEDEGARLRADFSTFLAAVISGMSKNRDQEEINILNSR